MVRTLRNPGELIPWLPFVIEASEQMVNGRQDELDIMIRTINCQITSFLKRPDLIQLISQRFSLT